MPSVSELLVRIDATTEGLRRELKRAEGELGTFSKKTDQQLSSIDGSFTKLGGGISKISGMLGSLGIAMGGVQLAKSFTTMADAATTMENRLKSVTSTSAELNNAQELLYQSSQANSVETSTSVELFARLSRALQGTGASTERVVEMVDTLSKMTKLSGTTTAEATSALLQFSQAMNKGKLNGDEFRSMAENLPMLLTGISQEIATLNGISLEQARAELQKMAEEGELTTDVMTSAIENMRDETVEAYGEMESTAGMATTRMWNALTRLVGKFDDVAGVSGSLIEKIDAVTGAFDFGVGALDRYGGSLASLLGWINAIPHPLGLLAQAAAGASAQVAQAAGEIEAAMKRSMAAREAMGSGAQAWQQQPGQGPKWGGNIATGWNRKTGTTGGVSTLAGKLGGGLDVLEATGGKKVTPLMNPMDMAALAGSNVDFTTFGVSPGGGVTGVTQDRVKLKFYKGQSKEEKSASESLQKQADKLREKTRTPQEEFQAEVAEYNDLLAKEMIDPDVYSRAFREAGDKMQKSLLSVAREKAKPGQDLQKELDARTERAKKAMATARQEYDAEVANLTELKNKGRLTEQEYKQGVGVARAALEKANKPKGGGKKTEAEKEQERAEREGKSVFKETRTEAEAYAIEIQRLDELLAKKTITEETHARAVAAATEAMEKNRSGFEGSRVAARAYLDEMARLQGLLSSGAISQDEYNARMIEAQSKYGEAKGNAAAYAAEVTRLDEALASGAISQEEHAASMQIAQAGMNEGLQESARLWEETRTPLERYNEELRRLAELWASGAIGDDTRLRAAKQAWEELHDELEETNATMKASKALGDDLGMAFASSFEDAIIEGGKLRDIMQGLWKDIQRIVVRQMVTVPLATGLSSILTGVTGAMMGGGATAMPPMPGTPGGGFASGGWVKGAGTSTSDSVMAMLSSGEFVVPAAVAARNRDLLNHLPKYASGGWVGPAPANSNGNISITLENKSSQPLKMEGSKSEGPGPDGRTMIRVMVVDAVKGALASGEFDRTMGARYGSTVQPIGR